MLPSLPEFRLININALEVLKEYLEKALKKVCEVVAELNGLRPQKLGGEPGFPVLHPDWTDIWIIQNAWENVFYAMDYVGTKFQEFRQRRGPDYPSVLNDYLKAGLSPKLERPAFGLPMQFRYRSAPGKQAMVQPENFNRRASPVIFRFLRLGNGKIALVLVNFKSAFLPSGEKLKITGQSEGARQRPQLLDAPGQDLIYQFRDHLGSHLEVRNWL